MSERRELFPGRNGVVRYLVGGDGDDGDDPVGVRHHHPAMRACFRAGHLLL